MSGGWMLRGIAITLPLLAASVAVADSTTVALSPTRIGGELFGDYFYSTVGGAQDSSAFALRRLDVTLEHDLSARIVAHATLEAEDGTLTSDGRLSPFVKFANLEFRDVLPGTSMIAGLAATPLWQTTEVVWGYRSVAVTQLELRGVGSASDLGVALEGSIHRAKPDTYRLMFGNGSGERPEDDRSKEGYGTITIRPGHAIVEPMLAYKGREGADDFVIRLLVAWQEERWALGAEAWNSNFGSSINAQGISAFGRARVGERFGIFARYDRYDPESPAFSYGYVPTFISHNVFAGVDYMPTPAVHVIPNIAIEGFSNTLGYARDTEMAARITLSYRYPD